MLKIEEIENVISKTLGFLYLIMIIFFRDYRSELRKKFGK